jgi:hypothetical protein
MESTTDDLYLDEALSNRVAALNLLDLGLGHLGTTVKMDRKMTTVWIRMLLLKKEVLQLPSTMKCSRRSLKLKALYSSHYDCRILKTGPHVKLDNPQVQEGPKVHNALHLSQQGTLRKTTGRPRIGLAQKRHHGRLWNCQCEHMKCLMIKCLPL